MLGNVAEIAENFYLLVGVCWLLFVPRRAPFDARAGDQLELCLVLSCHAAHPLALVPVTSLSFSWCCRATPRTL